MIKMFCSPITKTLLIFAGYVLLISALLDVSHSFRILINNIFGNWIMLGLIPSAALFLLCIGAYIMSVAMSGSSRLKQERIFILWRKIDGLLFIVFSLWFAVFLLTEAHSTMRWGEIDGFLPFTLAYLTALVSVTELTARIRDKEFKRSLHWVIFFRKFPIWRPLGAMTAFILAANLLFLVLLSPATGLISGFRMSFVLGFHFNPVWNFLQLEGIFQVTSAFTLIAITYFMMVFLNLAGQYDKANAEKIKSERFKSELITNVSHDIRTPLTSIINYVDLLKSEPSYGKSSEYICVLEAKSARLKVLIDDLMEASKAGTGNVSVTLEQVNLTELVGQIAGEFEEQFIQNNLTLVLREPDEPVLAYADSRHLWRILENLFSNSVKYSLPGTRVFAQLTQGEDSSVITLKNTSQTPLDLSGEALTEQFIRGDAARKSEGSGLGLYIAKNLAELMQGRLTIQTSGDLFEVEVHCRMTF